LPVILDDIGNEHRSRRFAIELFRMFMDNESFRKWLTQTVFDQTYEGGSRV
jgi:hypothetical protein